MRPTGRWSARVEQFRQSVRPATGDALRRRRELISVLVAALLAMAALAFATAAGILPG